MKTEFTLPALGPDAIREPGYAPLRVLQVCARFLPEMGGIETHVDEVTRRLAARPDLRVTVLTTDRGRRLPATETRNGVDIIRVPAWPRRRDYHLAPRVYSTVRSGQWDLVHCQGIHTPVPALAMLAARQSRTPYVVTFHTGGHSSTTRSSVRATQWKAMAPLLRRAAHLVGVSRSEANLFRKATGLNPGRFSVIRNGGGLPVGPAPDPPVPGRIVSCGRLERYKGHHRVIEALPHVQRIVPGAHLHIVGAGPYEAELRRRAAALGVADVVTIRSLDPSDRAAMAQTLNSAAVIAAFSDYEAHPIAVMEALTCGRPVVGYDVAGVADLVEDGLVRGITPGCDPTDAARTLVDAMRGPAPRLEDLPTWDTCVRDLLQVYGAAAGTRLS